MTDYLLAARKTRDPASRRRFLRLHKESKIRAGINSCIECPLAETRINAVPWSGPTDAQIALVGEAPGATEDKTGVPFTGRSGTLLDFVLDKADIGRDNVMVFNTLCCRPPNNRNPAQIELQACQPLFHAQLNLSKATVIVLMGRSAVVNVTGDEKVKMANVRGVPFWMDGGIWLPTYHPAYILRNRDMMGVLTADLRLAKAVVGGRHWPKIDPATITFSDENQSEALKQKLARDHWAVMYSRTLEDKIMVLEHADVAYPHRYGLLPVYTMEELAKVGEFGLRSRLTRDMVEKLHVVKRMFGGEVVA
jgi:DNA polymerase